ncbi:hypothetical protein RD792_005834 [Penstemon davidsonii]|uniref:Uncharacterized protein n=1 Tax=Penstemon davidsonii TaxID=160366 RepID=A0ABR0DE54_9LAMI|nr:hypothetical protein RD792_005834 [Penstemon davidsonii]
MVFLLSENRKYYVYVIAITLILVLTITPILCNNTTNTNGVLVKDIVTDTFFSEVANRADIVIKCKGNRGFFNRWAFLQALDSFPQFGTVGSKDDSAREIAA